MSIVNFAPVQTCSSLWVVSHVGVSWLFVDSLYSLSFLSGSAKTSKTWKVRSITIYIINIQTTVTTVSSLHMHRRKHQQHGSLERFNAPMHQSAKRRAQSWNTSKKLPFRKPFSQLLFQLDSMVELISISCWQGFEQSKLTSHEAISWPLQCLCYRWCFNHIMLEICPSRRSLLPESLSRRSCVRWVYGIIEIIGSQAAAWENELNVLRFTSVSLRTRFKYLYNCVRLSGNSCTCSLTTERCYGKKNASILRFPLCPQSECFGAWHCWHCSWVWIKGFYLSN